MKALVTGGTGFVGRYLVNRLLADGNECRVLVRPTSDRAGLDASDKLEFWEGDLTKPDSLSGIAADVDYVFHLAAEGHVSAVSEQAFRRFQDINVEGTRNLFEACEGASVQNFVHFSSTAAMGLIKKALVDESDPPEPVTPYQKSKLESEQVALEEGRKRNVATVIVRPCMIYGVGGKGEFHKMCRLMRRGMFPRVGLGRNLTPLVHVNDVVSGAVLAAEKGRAGEVYLLTSERSLPLAELREMAMEAWGKKAWYPYVPVWFMFAAAGAFELVAKLGSSAPVVTRRNVASTVWDREFSILKATRDLGYTPSMDFRTGIGETVRWFQANA